MSIKSTAAALVSIKAAEIRSNEELLGAIERARDTGDWLEEDVFVEILAVGMRLVALSASDLAREEGISRSAVSKWLSHAAVPSIPTRKTVVLWLEQNLKTRLDALRGSVPDSLPEEHEEVLEEIA